MHPNYKQDSDLGMRVHEHLLKVGLETPLNLEALAMPEADKIKKIDGHVEGIMEALGLDLTDDSLEGTPARVAKMYVREIFWGLDYSKFPKCTAVDNKFEYNDSFVLEQNVNIQSNCEHHFVVINGLATIAYIPHKKVLGLSKINRLAEFFAKRPQIQERLTEQICEVISFITESPDVAVYISAEHFCVKSRGIQDTGSSTITLSARGVFSNAGAPIRTEFLSCCRSVN